MAEPAQAPTANLSAYFNKLSASYASSTARSTENLFAQLLPRLAPVDSKSVIHDNASGPATATSVLLADPSISAGHPSIRCTDMVPAMVDAVTDLAEKRKWPNVEATVMKSDQAMDLPDNHFTHSITNFSIFNFTDRVKATSEVYRTLKPGGQVIVTTWQYFSVGQIIHETQKRIRSDAVLMPISGEEMYNDVAVKDVMVKGGFEASKLEVVKGAFVAKDENLQGTVDFMKGPFTDSARNGWTDDEKGQWGSVLDEVVEEWKKLHGGILFEMYAIIGTK